MILGLYLVPLGSALSGWLAVALAGKLVFRPSNPLQFGPVQVHGALPRHRRKILAAVSEFAVKEFFSEEHLVEQLEKLDIRDDVTAMLDGKIDAVLNKFVQKTPMVAMFLNDALKGKIKELVISEVVSELPVWQKDLAGKLISQINLKDTIQSKIASIDLEKIEQDLEEAAQEAMRPARWLGAAVGLLIGLLQLLLL